VIDDQDGCEWVNVSSWTSRYRLVHMVSPGQNPESRKTVVLVVESHTGDVIDDIISY